MNAALTLNIISGDANGDFTIDESAVLRVGQMLDRERQSTYSLTVQAIDQAPCDSVRFRSSAWIMVELLDVNDNAPTFLPLNTVYLPEDVSTDTVVMTVKAVDGDSGLNGHIEYSLTQSPECKFSINTTSGEVSVIGDLDRELVERVTIEVTASDKGQPPLSSSLCIRAIITDVNDNSPVFSQTTYTVTEDENIPPGSELLAVSATDLDEGRNGQVRYTTSSKHFAIDSVTGLISLFRNLDREQIPIYSFVVFATDDGSSPRSGTASVKVVLRDVNDFVPIFQPATMSLHILENINKVPQVVYQLLGLDDDLDSNSELTYKISRGNEEGKFSLSTNGELRLVQILDREVQGEYTLLVTATDAGEPPLTGTGTIIIIVKDLNDNSPLFEQNLYTTTISEATSTGTVILQVKASDADAEENGQISYSMEGEDSPFSIDPVSGEMITISTLDREVRGDYTLLVVANDQSHTQRSTSSASVVVIIQDVNDNPPEFLDDPYVANVPAVLKRGSTVYAVTARDRDVGGNADLRFSLFGPNANKFEIDPLRGVVFARHILKDPMDITVNVNVSDSREDPKMDSTTITVRFQRTTDFPQVSVDKEVLVYPENQAVDTVIAQVSALSNEKEAVRSISFYLAAGNLGDVFQVNQLTGEVIIKRTLDFEFAKQYQLWIEARDSSSPPFSSYVRVDVNVTDTNDNFPTFKQNIYKCDVYENVPASKVCNVSAVDSDSSLNGLLEYSIYDGNVNNAFNINRSTGVIRTVRMLDREQLALYTLIVEAKDKGDSPKTSTATIFISVLDINDNAPRFSQIFLAQVVENAPVGFTIARISTTDDDIGVNARSTYGILDHTATLPFDIDPCTGDLTVARALDRETTDRYVLRVHANDSSWDVNTDVTIVVADMNDNTPQFTEASYSMTIPEPAEKETFVLQVSATDPDLNCNGKIFYFLKHPNEFFRINASTGKIFTKSFIPLNNTDHSGTSQNRITFIVVASDLGELPSLSETVVDITIVNRNDYPPIFLPHRQMIPVPVNLALGTRVTKLIIGDKDSNGDGEYFITENGGSFLFGVEQSSGWIFVTNTLTSSLNKVFTLTVTATDYGIPPLSSNTTINFVITGKNIFTPQFYTLEESLYIPEDQPIGSVISNITASDSDEGINGQVTYSIMAGNEGGYFAVGNTTGLLTLVRSLDFEMESVYRLRIYGLDGGWISKTGSIEVSIFVQDVNDNPPVFCQKVFFATIAENSPCGSTILKLNATDNDTGIHAEMSYAIEDGDTELFSIDPQIGIITVQEILNFESVKFYELAIRVFNRYDRDQFSLSKVYVYVTGLNEYIPHFSKAQYNFVISEKAVKGTIVGSVTASDLDLGLEGVVYYILVGESKKKGFQIVDNTGEIVVSDNTKLLGPSHVLLRVLAKNSGRILGFDVDEALINVAILSVNDAPVFQSALYQAHIREDAPAGTSVFSLMDDDSDIIVKWNQLEFKIEDVHINNLFSINSNTGEIFVVSSLDRETVPSYNMTIIAVDTRGGQTLGRTQLVIVVVDVNDNSPVLVSTEGHVLENQPIGTKFGSLNAIDLDSPPNQGPFYYQLADSNSSSFVTLSPAGVLSTKIMFDRECVSDLFLPIIVQDSGNPSMSSVSIFHVRILDQNDNPPRPRNIHIQVNYFGDYFPGGFIGSVKPEDPDVCDRFNCHIVTNATASFAVAGDACKLLSGKLIHEEEFNLTIKASDKVHHSVSNSIYIRYRHFNNATIDSSVFLLITLPIEEFLDRKYLRLVETIDELLSQNNTKLHVFGMMPLNNQVLLMAAIKCSSGLHVSRKAVIDLFTIHREWLRTQIGIPISAIGFDPCLTTPCRRGVACTKQTSVSIDTVVLESSSVIFQTHVLLEPFRCLCPEGQLYRLDFDECPTTPCDGHGTGLNCPIGFFCSHSEGRAGSNCEKDINHCQQDTCQNGATCLNPPGGFQCKYPPNCTGTSGNQCDASSLGFEELSYMELPCLDPQNNTIYVEFATIKENALLLYNYDNNEGPEGEFLALEIVNGKMEFAYNLGDGTVRLQSTQQIADGNLHAVLATRIGKVRPFHACYTYPPPTYYSKTLTSVGASYVNLLPRIFLIILKHFHPNINNINIHFESYGMETGPSAQLA
ncbi:protocadherin Fat 4, partial [Leucoraja erinacea]|uniref:protocadherin Fat 4 n=1 Tax=Leucoraja erinaceus TaxID=7782 RepID=UPI0024582B4D